MGHHRARIRYPNRGYDAAGSTHDSTVRQAQEKGRPGVQTRYGRGVAVVRSVEAYDELLSTIRANALRAGIAEADEAVEHGCVVAHEQVEGRMRARMDRDGV